MSGETAAIQRVANKITEEIFSVFKWQRAKREDMNWDCCLEHHNKKTHPSDVVFFYVDPYEEEVVYLNTDLKSYGENSIAKGGIETALKSLILSVECANVSSDFSTKYIDELHQNYNIKGLLFLYNHDHLYHKDFYENIMSKVDLSSLNHPENNKVYLLDPYKISDIINIAFDIVFLIGRGSLPTEDNYNFYYPDLSLTRKKHAVDSRTAATIELLTSPYIIIKHNSFFNKKNEIEEGYVIYYNQPGNSVDEFVYFFDMLANYQILTENKKIRVRLSYINHDPNAIHYFERAKRKYSACWFLGNQEELFDNLSLEFSQQTIVNYNLESIGMNIR